MSEEAVIAALAVLGLVCELGGLLLVVRQIGQDRARARAVIRRPIRVSIGPATEVDRAGAITPVGGREATLEERLGRIERELAQLDIDGRIAELRKQVTQEVSDAVQRAEKDVQDRDRALRDLIADMLDGGLGWRKLGVGLFAVGATLAAASSVWSALAG